VQEAILAEEQARGLHPRDLLAKLEEIHTCVDGITCEHSIEAG
jgi:hypothetical protein